MAVDEYLLDELHLETPIKSIRNDEVDEHLARNNAENVQNHVFDVLLTGHLSIFISVINQLNDQNFCFKISLFQASTCFEHMCSSSGVQNCIAQPLVSSHLEEAVSCTAGNLCTRRPPRSVMIPEAV